MTLAIIQARLGSTRFPRKALAKIGRRCVLDRVLDRAEEIRGLDRIVVAVPRADYAEFDDTWTDSCWCPPSGIKDEDVLSRYALCAAEFGALVIMRLTGDCPMLNPRICEQVLALYDSEPGIEYASNIAPGYVDGEDCEVFSRKALEWAHREATDPYDREHVTSWLRRHVRCATLPAESTTPKRKTSIDTPEDLDYVRQLLTVSA